MVKLCIEMGFVFYLSAEPIAECKVKQSEVKVTRRQKDVLGERVNNSVNKVNWVLCDILILFWSLIHLCRNLKKIMRSTSIVSEF